MFSHAMRRDTTAAKGSEERRQQLSVLLLQFERAHAMRRRTPPQQEGLPVQLRQMNAVAWVSAWQNSCLPPRMPRAPLPQLDTDQPVLLASVLLRSCARPPHRVHAAAIGHRTKRHTAVGAPSPPVLLASVLPRYVCFCTAGGTPASAGAMLATGPVGDSYATSYSCKEGMGGWKQGLFTSTKKIILRQMGDRYAISCSCAIKGWNSLQNEQGAST